MQLESGYLDWRYLIFIAPAGAAALLLLLSAIRMGGHHASAHAGHTGGMGHHHTGGAAHHTGGAHVGPRGAHAPGTGRANSKSSQPSTDAPHMPWASSFLLAVLGIGRVPLPLVAEMFCLCWGVAGFCAIQAFAPPGGLPGPGQMIFVFGIALAGGLVGSRISAELLARLLPRDESSIVSRNGLYGLTGEVVYPISTNGGRLHVYDDYGTLHDETCRVPADHPGIAKGRHVRIVDMDADGNLIVEEAPEPIRLT